MDQTQNADTVQIDRQSYIWLAVAALLLIFANGRWAIPVASWLGPVYMVRFLRGQRPLKGFLIGYVVLASLFFISWRGVAPIPFITFYILTGLLFGLYFLLPYLLDRLLFFRFTGFLATLVLPVSWVAVEFIDAKLNPYGHWPLIAYSQHGNLPLLQIISITGIWGVTFLMAWFASTVNWVWETNFEWKKFRRGLADLYRHFGSRVVIWRRPPDHLPARSQNRPHRLGFGSSSKRQHFRSDRRREGLPRF